MDFKKILLSILVLAPLALVPSSAFATVGAGWAATSTTQGWIFPTKINGVEQVVVGNNFIATSTTATSTLPNLNITNLKFGSDYLSDITGPGLKISNGALTASTTVSDVLINVKDYGALGDGSTDDTAAITRALSVQQNASTATCLVFPAGVYPMSATIAPTNRLCMIGYSGATGSLQTDKTKFLSRILHTGDNQPIITLSEEGDRIENLHLQYSNYQDYTKTNSVGIKFGDGSMGARIHNVGMSRVAYGFYAPSGGESWQHDISNIRIDSYSISCFTHYASNTSTTINQFYCQNLYEPLPTPFSAISAVSKVGSTITFTVDQIPGNMKIGRQIYVTGLAPSYLNTIFFVNATTSTSIDVLATSSDALVVTDPIGQASVPGQPALGPVFDIVAGVWNIQGLDIEHVQASSSAIVKFNSSMANINDLHFENVYWNTNAFNTMIYNTDGILNINVVQNINSGCTQYQICYLWYNNNARSQTTIGLYQTRDFSSKFASVYKAGAAGATANYTTLGNWNQQTSFRAGSDPTPTDFGATARVLTGKFSTTTVDTDTFVFGKLGIGTTSPYAPLSVVGSGGVVAETFTATSTTIASQFPYASSTYASFITSSSTNLRAGFATTTNSTSTNLYAITASTSVLYANNIGIGTSTATIASLNISRADANNIFYFARTGVSDIALDFISGRNNLKLRNGRLNIAESSITDATAKSMHITMPNYDGVTGGVNCMMLGAAGATANTLALGGSSSTCFPATQMLFYTGTSSKVVDGGNIAMMIDGQSRVGMGTLIPTSKLHIVGLGTTTSDVLNIASSTGTTQFIVKYDDKVGIGTSTPNTLFEINDRLDGLGQSDIVRFDPITGGFTNRLLSFTRPVQNAWGIDSTIANTGVAANLVLQSAGGANVGIGTTSPYAKLSVAGEIVGNIMTATSTTATSTFPLLSTNAININGTYVTNLWATTSSNYWLISTSSVGTINTMSGLATIGSTTGTTTVRGGTILNGSLGIGTSTPDALVDIYDVTDGGGQYDRFVIDPVRNGFTNRRLSFTRPVQTAWSIDSLIDNSGVGADLLLQSNGGSRVGIGTTSPYTKLSVVGEIVGNIMTATSTTATSTFPLLSTNAINLNGTYVNSLWSTTSSNYWLLSTSSVGTINTMSGLASIGSTTGTTTLQGATILNGLVGIGTSSPTSLVDIYDVTDGGGQYDEVSIDPVTGGFTNRLLKIGRPVQGAWGIDSIIKSNGVGADLVLQANGGGNLGVGTTSPISKFTANGNVWISGVATSSVFVATSTTATSTFPNLTSTYINLGSDTLNDFTGTGILNVGGALTLDTTASGLWATTSDTWNFGVLLSATTSLPNIGSLTGLATIGSSTGTTNLNGKVGIGSTTPFATFAINPVAGVASNQFVVGSSTGTSFIINNSGNVGIGTTTPVGNLIVQSATNSSSAFKVVNSGAVNVFGVDASTGIVNLGWTSNQVPASTWGYDSGTNGGFIQFSTGALGDNNFAIRRTNYLASGDYTVSALGNLQFSVASGKSFNFNNGNVGIGTTSPVTNLVVSDSSNSTTGSRLTLSRTDTAVVAGDEWGSVEFYGSDLSGGGAGVHAKIAGYTADTATNFGNLGFYTGVNSMAGMTERMTINATGNIGVGTTTPQGKFVVHSGSTGAATIKTGILINTNFSDVDSGNALSFGVNGRSIPMAQVVSRTAGSNGELAFHTTSNFTTTAPTEKMRIASSGNVGIGTTSPWAMLSLTGTMAASGLTTAAGTPSSICMNSVTFEITVNAALTCTVSDEDQKTPLVPLTVNALEMIKKIQPSSFEYNDNLGRTRYGFGAQSLQKVDEHLADGFDKDGIGRSIDLPALIAINTKAIQELNAKVDAISPSEGQKDAKWPYVLAISLLGVWNLALTFRKK